MLSYFFWFNYNICSALSENKPIILKPVLLSNHYEKNFYYFCVGAILFLFC